MNPILSLEKSVGTCRAFKNFGALTSIRFIWVALLFIGLSICHGWCDAPLTVRIGAYENHPKIYTNSQGMIVGIFPDILDTIAYEEGWRLQYVFGTWAQCLDRLEKNEIDLMVDVAYSDERNKRYDFSDETVFLNWAALYTKSGFAIQSLLDLRGKTVAVMRESIHTEGSDGIKRLASKFDLDLTYIEVDGYDDVFGLLDSAAADAGVVNRLYGALNEKNHDIVKSTLLFNPVQLKFAAAKGDPYSRSLLERVDLRLKNLKNDPGSVYHEIISAYLNGTQFIRRFKGGIRTIPLTSEERAWLKDHPVIRIGVDPAYAPYSFRDKDGSYQGLAMDFITLMGRHLGLHMKVVAGLKWPQILEGARNGSLDVVLTAVKTGEREAYLRFSKIYIPTPLVIMARQDAQTIDGPEDMAGHKVALVKGYSSAERAMAEHPAIKPHMVDTPLEGLTAVSVGEADLYVGVLGINDYLSKKHGLANIKAVARYDMRYVGQRFGVRKDWPRLVSILDKTLEAIPEKKKIAIFNAWISIKSALHGAAALQQRNCLTEEETNWIRNHPTIRLGVDPEFAPFEFFAKDGAYNGVASDYVKILNFRLGLNMQVVPNITWKESMAAVRQRELDVLPCVAVTEDRKLDLAFSDPYLSFHRVIINRTDAPFFSDLKDIAGLKVAAQANTSHSGYLKDHTNIQPILYTTLQEALRAVSDGQADALVGNIASATYWIRRLHLTNLKVAAPVSHELQRLHFAIRKDWPELVPIINKGLASISLYKEDKIRKHWIDVEYDPGIDPVRFWKRIMQVAGGALLILAAVAAWNFMLKKEIRKRRVIEKNLTYRLDFETLLLEMSSLFINVKTNQINEQISQALKRIAAFVDAQSGFVFDISDNGKRFFSSHGWFSDQLESKMDHFRQLNAATMPWWVQRLKRNEVIAVPSVEQLPDQAVTEKELLLSTGINAIVSIPMGMGGEVTGFLGVACIQNERHWSNDEITLLQAMAQIFTNALQRKQAEEALQRSHDELEQRITERTTDLAEANVSLQQEIAERKRMEVEKEMLAEQLIHAQKMEAIGTMAGGIAHDFNNILMPIMGYAEMTKLTLAPGLEGWKYLDHIINAGNRARDLIKQILTFSRQTGHDAEPVNLKALVKETLRLMRSSLPLAVEIRESIDPNVGDIIGNPTQIHQLLMNLCTNARHAMRERGGILTVSVDEVRYPDGTALEGHPMESGTYIRLRVGDTGQGIQESIKSRILEPYFTTKAPDEGTGLGLSVVHGIVKKHGGHLTFSSEVNKGTTFQILFPGQSAATADETVEPEQIAQGGTEHIWVLDDDNVIAQMMQRMLKNLGYNARAFTRSDQLIGEFKKNGGRVDLVITDMTMPNLTGVELARQLIDLRADIPIILCSGFDETIDEAGAKEFGIREYLMKPVDMKELAGVVRKVLDET
jgi:ABC-type amino acid transport substrate-binding protein/signal transduction histidine kinase/ActR/RegA family two-component response regulator